MEILNSSISSTLAYIQYKRCLLLTFSSSEKEAVSAGYQLQIHTPHVAPQTNNIGI